MAVLLPLPQTAVLVGVAVLFAFASLGTFWAPAMALLSDASEEAGLDQALAFSISNLAWALGHVVGSGAGAALADATSDALPYALLGAACAGDAGHAALAGAARRGALARSPLTRGSSARATCRRAGTA